MGLAGLPLATLLGIFGAASALVVVFYILKLRRRAVPVPFSRIWDSVLRDKQATELFSKLRRMLSLLLQLLLLALLVLALGDPKPQEDLRAGRHLVLLLDASASMKATDVKPTRLAAAKAEAEKIVRGLGASDRAIVVQMGSVPMPRSSMSGDQTELLQAIARVSASDTRAELEAGLAFGRDSLRGMANPELVVIGDGAHAGTAELSARVSLEGAVPRFVPIGKSGKNLAITEFSVRRYPLDKSRYEVMLEVANLNDTPADVELELSGDGVVVDVTRLKLGPNEKLPRFYQDLAGASRTLTARIKAGPGLDELPADDVAYALLPERRRARILLVTAGNTYLEAALLLDEYLDVSQVAPGARFPDGRFDVAIFDAVAPPLTDQIGSVLYLNPPAAGSPLPFAADIEDFGFDTWERKSPVLRFMSMGDIQVAKGHSFKPQAGDKLLGASDQGPILVSGARAGHRFVALGFDPRDSDLVLRIAWPLFVLNSINAFVEEDTGYVSSYRTGEIWRIAVPGSLGTVNLLEPGGAKHSVPVSDGRAVFRGELAGFYKLSGGSDDALLGEFAANLSDLPESRIAPQKELLLAGKKASAVSIAPVSLRSEIWIYLLLAVIAVSVVEWITYHRRVTV
ncbi:MAG TPA: VWA domain-containing protein [Polyangiaceae bacterium]|nr:VWA domain-containing protein [Polyangiaceae bacterium]